MRRAFLMLAILLLATSARGAGASQPASPQQQARLTLEALPPQVVIEQPFTLSVQIALKQPGPRESGISPLHPLTAPVLRVPFLDPLQQEGLHRRDARDLLGPLLLQNPRAPGFRINDFTADSAPAAFRGLLGGAFHAREARFGLDTDITEQDGARYYRFRLDIPFHADRPGRYTFGPVALTGRIITGLDARGHGILTDIDVQSDSQTVTVTDLPRDTRPAWFTGTIGTGMEVAAELDAQVCNEGDPLTLSVTIGGDIGLHRLTTPRLHGRAGLSEHFRVYDDAARSETFDTYRRFHYTIRPVKAGTLEVPPLPFAYFNPHTGTYQTVTTDAIPVRANRVTGAVIPEAGRDAGIVRLGSRPDDDIPAPFLFPIDTASSGALFNAPLHLPLLAAGPVLWLIGLVAGILRQRQPARQAAQRRRTACSRALQRLDRLAASQPSEPERRHAIPGILQDYLSACWNIPPGGSTPQESIERLAAQGADAVAARQLGNLQEALTKAAFSAIAPDREAFVAALTAARKAIRELDRAGREGQA